jgi:hypothetical protein
MGGVGEGRTDVTAKMFNIRSYCNYKQKNIPDKAKHKT